MVPIAYVMKPNLLVLLTYFFLFFESSLAAQTIWEEHFTVPEKGIWGNANENTIHEDFDGVVKWSLEYDDITLSDSLDYAKTVTTSGGRFECRDVNGEVTWRSEEIDISEYFNVSIQLAVSETGSGENTENKYLKVFYRLNDNYEILLETNGENSGNWGARFTEQDSLNGEKLQIVVKMNNHYASDKVILDEIVVMGKEKNPVMINPGDVLINEVLFNPFPDGEDYVEIYNHSEKQIPLNKLFLASRDKSMELTQIYQLSKDITLFEPQSYLALTKDTEGVFPFYTIRCPSCFMQMERLPSFNNDDDVVVLLNENLQVIDELYYTEKMHAPLLRDVEGIALERISFSSKINAEDNWYSASTESGYGTPGYINSQFSDNGAETTKVYFEPESFSPNSDGYNDEYLIRYKVKKPGYMANISIFDASGRLITELAKNEILGTSGLYIWNGENESGQRQDMGVYVVIVELFDLFGNIHRFKDGVVLTDVLE